MCIQPTKNNSISICTIWCSRLSKCLSSISLQNYSLKRKHLFFVHVVLFIQFSVTRLKIDIHWLNFFLMDKCMHVTHGVNVFIEFSVLVFTKTVFMFSKSMLCFFFKIVIPYGLFWNMHCSPKTSAEMKIIPKFISGLHI